MISVATLNKISKILKDEGCDEIFLFGSQLTGKANSNSDIDIGIKGLHPSRFFSVYSRLDSEIEENIDFVDFDEQASFYTFLCSIGEIKKIG